MNEASSIAVLTGGLHLSLRGLGTGAGRSSTCPAPATLFNEDGSVVVCSTANLQFQNWCLTRILGHTSAPLRHRSIVHPGKPGGSLCRALSRHVRVCAVGRKQENPVVVRDRFGVKPLYYAFLVTVEFIFGSD